MHLARCPSSFLISHFAFTMLSIFGPSSSILENAVAQTSVSRLRRWLALSWENQKFDVRVLSLAHLLHLLRMVVDPCTGSFIQIFFCSPGCSDRSYYFSASKNILTSTTFFTAAMKGKIPGASTETAQKPTVMMFSIQILRYSADPE